VTQYHKTGNRTPSRNQFSKAKAFEESFKHFLGKEFNAPFVPGLNKEGMLSHDDEGHLQETFEEKRIIMEMYNRDNRERRIRQQQVKTALTKHPLVPRRNDKKSMSTKPNELPLLKDMRKNDDSKNEILPAKDLNEKIRRHKVFLRGLKERLKVYKQQDAQEERFELHKRLTDYMSSKGYTEKNHKRKLPNK
jgi:hypothetical protein